MPEQKRKHQRAHAHALTLSVRVPVSCASFYSTFIASIFNVCLQVALTAFCKNVTDWLLPRAHALEFATWTSDPASKYVADASSVCGTGPQCAGV